MNLKDLNCKESAFLLQVPDPRMTELGLTPGTRITVLSKGAFQNPIEIQYGDCRLLIDKKTAGLTEVKPCN